jgi:Predicted integral membrane protein
MKDKKYVILTIVWMIVIFLFSSQTGDNSNMNNVFIVDLLKKIGIDFTRFASGIDINFLIRKAAHVTEYLILGMLLYKAYESYLFSGYEMASLFTGFIYACTDEFHQYFIPGRGPSFRDVLVDTSGVVLGVVLLWVIYSRRTSRVGRARTQLR